MKHVGGREPIEVVIDRYQPQLHFQMECCQVEEIAISIARCLDEPIVEYISRDPVYAGELMRRVRLFMTAVQHRLPLDELPPAPPPANPLREVNMNHNDIWRHHALEWIQTRGAAEICKDCEKVLKELVPADARKAFGHGVRITRDRAGRLSCRKDEA